MADATNAPKKRSLSGGSVLLYVIFWALAILLHFLLYDWCVVDTEGGRPYSLLGATLHAVDLRRLQEIATVTFHFPGRTLFIVAETLPENAATRILGIFVPALSVCVGNAAVAERLSKRESVGVVLFVITFLALVLARLGLTGDLGASYILDKLEIAAGAAVVGASLGVAAVGLRYLFQIKAIDATTTASDSWAWVGLLGACAVAGSWSRWPSWTAYALCVAGGLIAVTTCFFINGRTQLRKPWVVFGILANTGAYAVALVLAAGLENGVNGTLAWWIEANIYSSAGEEVVPFVERLSFISLIAGSIVIGTCKRWRFVRPADAPVSFGMWNALLLVLATSVLSANAVFLAGGPLVFLGLMAALLAQYICGSSSQISVTASACAGAALLLAVHDLSVALNMPRIVILLTASSGFALLMRELLKSRRSPLGSETGLT